jgi:hypothetical protein
MGFIGFKSNLRFADWVLSVWKRNYFGVQTYERVDKLRGEWFHTDWGGNECDFLAFLLRHYVGLICKHSLSVITIYSPRFRSYCTNTSYAPLMIEFFLSLFMCFNFTSKECCVYSIGVSNVAFRPTTGSIPITNKVPF